MEGTAADLAATRQWTALLVGKAPWEAALGYGSFVTLNFGRRLPGRSPAARPIGEWHLWVQYVAWRLEEGESFLAGSEDARPEMAAAVERMQGRTLLALDVLPPAFDTILTFEGGLIFRLFPVYTEEYDHWWLLTPDGNVLTIGPGVAWSYHSASEPWQPPRGVR